MNAQLLRQLSVKNNFHLIHAGIFAERQRNFFKKLTSLLGNEEGLNCLTNLIIFI